MKHNKLLMTGCSLAFTTALLLSGCSTHSTNTASSSPSTTPDKKIKVIAAENFYGEVAQAVGGDRVEVKSILTNPNVDPHEYEPTPEVAKEITDAQVIVYNGIGYDDWMDKILKAGSSTNTKTVINVGNDLLGKKVGDNPHVWYAPEIMPKLANKIADDLSKIDPSQDQAFHQRAKDYIATLDPLNKKIQQLKQASPTPIDVSEPVFDYMLKDLNLNINDPNFAKAIEEGSDPIPADLIQLQNDMKNKKVKFFVYNIQNSSATVDNIVKLANSAGIPVVKVTETEPEGKNYLQWMMDQLNEVENALKVRD
ncbi:metal ABC transporter substrate-binding protein [Collibacillus ludicampi]|uniref:Metal ABC transporter substrate-binding protein n=1 Tax=Collibacillus ludicampi TaxID=2771369 RepID=A0AAV4LBG8_9BACL|nr:zinc ABC transporter substrate-binding protein [Collibacillus ludicampi]GIM45143.1 metal ABC transporter substrate-binding protein [Collibacillus ludicampi]